MLTECYHEAGRVHYHQYLQAVVAMMSAVPATLSSHRPGDYTQIIIYAATALPGSAIKEMLIFDDVIFSCPEQL